MSNKKRSDWKSVLLGLVTLGVLLILAWLSVSYILSLPKEVAGPMIAAVAAVSGILLSRRNEKRKEVEQQLRQQKTPVYEEFTKLFLGQMMKATPDAPAASQAQIETFFRNWMPKLTIWGSDDVVREFIAWKRGLSIPTQTDLTRLLTTEQVLLTIRADLGHSNKGLHPGDLLSLYITDIDDVMANTATLRSVNASKKAA